MNMKKAISAFLSTALVASSAFAGPIVNKLGKNAFNTQIAAGIEGVLGKWNQSAGLMPTVAFYDTFPAKTMLSLNDVSMVSKSDDSDSIVLTDYVSIGAQSGTGSSLGLRMALAPMESRLKVAESLAETGLIKTGDILVSTRPLFANSLQYLAIQLLNTHISTAVVVNEGGKKRVYNIDMPMDGDMLGGAALGFGKSALDSPHFVADNSNFMVHIVRPRLTEAQRSNMQKWYEKSLAKARAKTMYPSSLSFNSDYGSPIYRPGNDIAFVGDVGRLLLDQKLQTNDHLQMFCSEFAWAMLSLKDCNPDTTAKDFQKNKQPSCVNKFFEPMLAFGQAFSGGNPSSDQLLYGMADGIPMLIQATGANAQVSNQLIDFALPGQDKEAKGLSSGHKQVAKDMAPLIGASNGYFKLALVKSQMVSGQDAEINRQTIEGTRAQLNAASARNYSPTGFSIHAAMPSNAVQKKLDYVATLKYVPKAKLKDLQSK